MTDVAFVIGVEPTAFRLGVQSPCESFVKNVQFCALWCVFIKNMRVFILKTLNILRNFRIIK